MRSRRAVGDTVLVSVPGKDNLLIGRIDKLDAHRAYKCALCVTEPDHDTHCYVWPNVELLNPLHPQVIEWVFHIPECRMFDYVGSPNTVG